MPAMQPIDCKNCALYRLCLPTCVGESDLKLFDDIIVRHAPIAKGKHWFRAGDAFESIYAVRSGSVKTYRPSADGEDLIAGIFFPGELIGLDAIHAGSHAYSAQAIESASVCEIPFNAIERLSERIPELNQQLVRIMSRELQRDRALIVTLGNKTAEQRVAWLLHRIAAHLETRRYSMLEFELGMSRRDIGGYLGLAVETVSRVITRFQSRGLLVAQGKQIRVRDMDRLKQLADMCSAN